MLFRFGLVMVASNCIGRAVDGEEAATTQFQGGSSTVLPVPANGQMIWA
jgi:hypothetical protein